jgi:hypothetical protein
VIRFASLELLVTHFVNPIINLYDTIQIYRNYNLDTNWTSRYAEHRVYLTLEDPGEYVPGLRDSRRFKASASTPVLVLLKWRSPLQAE